ncbi:DUF6083 domain-containing protein [Kineococcus arenarius]|uniref:DUF6083 domain-containing protein n=1 Tax=Kineococcus sp. SYSU DK007 TaxID=3383128 RepID=UPI003D7C449F
MSEEDAPAPGAVVEPDPVGLCAFCGGTEDVGEQERLGVRVRVCARCTARFSAVPAPEPEPAPEPAGGAGLPPTLGQHSPEVLRHLARVARIAAARPFTEEDCPRCSGVVHVYRRTDGEVARLAKEAVLATAVPVQDRWRVRDGRAEPAGDDPGQVGARLLHAVVCGAAAEPGNPRLRQVWRTHREASSADDGLG